MALAPGDQLGPYEVVALLGTGGMGEVYRARDLRLGRDIAIKVLPEAVAADPERRRRLEREARAAATLNHPAIVTIYSVEQLGGLLVLTMELVEGQSLARAIPKGGLPVAELLAIAVPLTDAVAAAHAKGIIHRDLKPANVMVGTAAHDGRVKVLDFGLARLDASSIVPGVTTATLEGRVVGTVAYMSPEQAAGAPVDARSDLFSLGVVLYEMATGRQPFTGDTVTAQLASILRDTPPSVVDLNPDLPPELGRIVKHCLVKDPARRYQTAVDLRNELSELQQDLNSGSLARSDVVARPRARASRRFLAAGAGVAVVAALAIVYLWFSGRGIPGRAAAAGERTFTQLTRQPGLQQFPSLSPDGKWIVYAANDAGNMDIYLQSVGGHNAINLTKDSPADDTQPAFSPDGDSIAFRSERDGGGLFVMGRTGESVRRVSDVGYTPAWSPDGTQMVFATASPDLFNHAQSDLWILNLATGKKRRLSAVTDGAQPSWSPHGNRIAFWSSIQRDQRTSQRDILTVPASDGATTALTTDAALDVNPAWSPDGRYVYFSSDRGGSINLWRVAIDEASGRPLAPPEAVTAPSNDVRQVSVSADGQSVVYASFSETSGVQRADFDPGSAAIIGQPQTVLGGSRFLSHVSVSPDGNWLAFYLRDRSFDVWISRSDGSTERQLTSGAYDRNPVFSPDGQWVAFFSNRSGKHQIWLIKPDGSGLRQVTDAPEGAMSYNQWSPDGTKIYYTHTTSTSTDFFVFEPMKPWREQKPQVFSGKIDARLVFFPSGWSPDGARMLGDAGPYDSDRTEGIYEFALPSRRFTRLLDRGSSVGWLKDGRRLLFIDQRRLFVLDSVTKSTREILSIAPDDFDSVAISPDNRTIYFTRVVQQGNIWLMKSK